MKKKIFTAWWNFTEHVDVFNSQPDNSHWPQRIEIGYWEFWLNIGPDIIDLFNSMEICLQRSEMPTNSIFLKKPFCEIFCWFIQYHHKVQKHRIFYFSGKRCIQSLKLCLFVANEADFQNDSLWCLPKSIRRRPTEISHS